MKHSPGRDVRLNMRTTTEQKDFLQQAAEVAGFSNLTNFVMTAARKEANRILSDSQTTYLSPKDWEHVNTLVDHPPEPNGKLKALLKGE